MAGQKLRINITALVGTSNAGKFLICVDEGVFIQDLATKAKKAAVKAGFDLPLLRLDNVNRAHLPEEEPVGDVLRDGDSIFAVFKSPEDCTKSARLSDVGSLEEMLSTSPAGINSRCGVNLDASQSAVAEWAPRPGPITKFEDDDSDDGRDGVATDVGGCTQKMPLFLEPAKKESYFPEKRGTGDWEVQDLTPKLREFIATRFAEVHGRVAEPGNSFLIVQIRPREPECALPVRYSVARCDIIEFERLCGKKILEIRSRLNYFDRCLGSLQALCDSGHRREDYTKNMLPYRFRTDGEVESLIEEANSEGFGTMCGGARPIIVVDTSGATGLALPYVKAGLKRMLYSFLVAKSKFNFIQFSSRGQPFAFDQDMAPPAAQRLREAEEWIDSMRLVRRSPGPLGTGPDLLESLRLAVSAREVDVVYLVTSGLSPRCDPDYFRVEVHARNLREIPIHVIGVDCEGNAELNLRRLAEENKGTFRHKRFNVPETFSSGPKRVYSGEPHLGGGLTIGGQIEILTVMSREDECQAEMWVEEQKCANQLLLATSTQTPVPDPKTARQAALRATELPALRPRMQDLGCGGPKTTRSEVPPAALHGQGATNASMQALASTAAAVAESKLFGDRGTTPRHGRRTRSQRRTRSSSQGRVMGQGFVESRRPSVANPWDRPTVRTNTGVLKISQLRDMAKAAAAGIPPGPLPAGHGGVTI